MADLPPGTLLAPATRSRLRDVAARAGVSATTASRVLNGNPTGLPVSEETVQRVREAAAELQYHPNAAARALGTRQTETIALIVPVVEDDEHNSHRHSHLKLSEVLSGICGVTRPHNYRLLIQMADRHFLETRAYLGLARSATVDGFIWWGAPVPSELLALHYPVVALNASADGVPHHRVLHDPAPESDSRRGRRLGVRDAAGESDDPRDLRVSRALRDGRRPGAILPPPSTEAINRSVCWSQDRARLSLLGRR